MKTIYNYNRATGEYINSSTIHKDDFGNYNLPAFSTEIKPEFKDSHITIFDISSKKWDIIEIVKDNIMENKEELSEYDKVIQKRVTQYDEIGNALDSIYKYFNYRRMQGDELTQELDEWVNNCTTVKRNNPLPETEE